MKPYIDFNMQKRKEATNEAHKNHFKRLHQDIHVLIGKSIIKNYLQFMKRKYH